MWFEHDNGDVVNLETGQGFRVTSEEDPNTKVQAFRVTAVPAVAGHGAVVLRDGYRAEVDAYKALSGFLSKQRVKPVTMPPVDNDDDEQDGEEN